MLKLFMEFIEQYNGPKLFIRCAGGPASFAKLMTVPGSTKVLGFMEFFSDSRELDGYLISKQTSYVNLEVAEELADEDSYYQSRDKVAIGCTCAFTTNRYRQGENEAYVVINGKAWHLMFPKLSEEEHGMRGPLSIAQIREWEDMCTTMFILKTVLPSLDYLLPEMVLVEPC